MATVIGPNDAPHGRVTIFLERYEAEALGRFVTEAAARYVYADEDAAKVVEALTRIAEGATV